MTSELERVGGYRVLKQIAVGGQATVFRARKNRREVALKVALKLGENRGLEREARLLRKLGGVGFPALEGMERLPDGRLALSLEWIDGGSIAQRVDFTKPLPWPLVVRLMGPVAEALAALHREGWVHGDLRPPNVMLGADGQVRLIDLGTVARRGSRIDRQVLGNPHCCAPEIWARRSITPKADLYSWGVMTYELLTSELPYARGSVLALNQRWGDDLARWERAHCRQRPRRLSSQLPATLRELVMRCLEKDPRRRPASARVLVGALAALLASSHD